MKEQTRSLEGILFTHCANGETRIPIAALLCSTDKAHLAFFAFSDEQAFAQSASLGKLDPSALIAQMAIEEAYQKSRESSATDGKRFEKIVHSVCHEATSHANIEAHGPLPAGEFRDQEQFESCLMRFRTACEIFAQKLPAAMAAL